MLCLTSQIASLCHKRFVVHKIGFVYLDVWFLVQLALSVHPLAVEGSPDVQITYRFDAKGYML